RDRRSVAERLLDLRRVPVCAADPVGPHRAHDVGGQQFGFQRAARAGGAGGGDDDDVLGVDQVAREQRGEGEDRRGGVAAGGGDLARCLYGVACAGQLGQSVGPLAGVRCPGVVGGPCVRVV